VAADGAAKEEPVLFSDDGIFHRLLAGVVVERDVAGFEESFEAFPAGGHVVDGSSQVVFRTQRFELLIHPAFEFIEQRSRSELALRVTFVVGEFTQFVFDIEQPPEVSHRCRGLCGWAERMQFLELTACMRMTARNSDPPLRIGTQQFVADVSVGHERALEVRKECGRAGT